MKLFSIETIAAIATPPGHGGIGVVRISGLNVSAIAAALLGTLPAPRTAVFRKFSAPDGLIDEGIALYFPAPHSFTGEDVLELQGHGGPAVMHLLLEAVLASGARLARPGEFSERAFLNNKLDLTQAEAVADLIASSTVASARAAVRSLQGVFSEQVNALADALIALRILVEAAIDFPDEEVETLQQVGNTLEALADRVTQLLKTAEQGRVLRDGMTVVIAGQPNVGKSSLLNRLAGRETAIVTAIPGTTRDVLRETISIEGMPVHVIDTAGLRESDDLIEQEGIRRAWIEMSTADRVFMVIDDVLGVTDVDIALRAQLPREIPVTIVRNKIDQTGQSAGMREGAYGTEVFLSAKTGEGMDMLCAHLTAAYRSAGEGTFSARRRHVDALQRTLRALQQAILQAHGLASELVAEELRAAHHALGEITGAFTSEDLLSGIFSSFCIGK